MSRLFSIMLFIVFLRLLGHWPLWALLFGWYEVSPIMDGINITRVPFLHQSSGIVATTNDNIYFMFKLDQLNLKLDISPLCYWPK